MSRFGSARKAFEWAIPKLKIIVFYGIPGACFGHTVFDYVGELSPAMGASMLPTLNMSGDTLIIERLPGWRNRLRVGGVVVFTSPMDPSRRAVKRILGMEGDTLCVDPTKDPLAYVQIPRGHVWLQGDNYSNSTDSRVYGPIPISLLRGRVVACFWPSPRLVRNNVEIIPGKFK